MALVKITFDGSSVSSKQDADIDFYLQYNIPLCKKGLRI